MSSPGQIVGGIVGGIIGFFAGGNVMLGASIGMAIGGAIDPPKGPKIEGPRLSDTSVQTSGYGNPVPRVYGGAVGLYGTLFWIEGNALKEVSTTTEQGGKGGSSTESTTYSYFATFGLALCEGEITGIRRIWFSGKLIYDAEYADLSGLYERIQNSGSTSILATVAESVIDAASATKYNFTVFNGSPTQQPSARMQADLGIANTPAYRNTAWILFEDIPLEKFGNTLMGLQIKVEVIKGSITPALELVTSTSTPIGDDYGPALTLGSSVDPFHIYARRSYPLFRDFYQMGIYAGSIVENTDMYPIFGYGYPGSSGAPYIMHDMGGILWMSYSATEEIKFILGWSTTDLGDDAPNDYVFEMRRIAKRQVDGEDFVFVAGPNYGGVSTYYGVGKYDMAGVRVATLSVNLTAPQNWNVGGAVFRLSGGTIGVPLVVDLYDDDLAFIETKTFTGMLLSSEIASWIHGSKLYGIRIGTPSEIVVLDLSTGTTVTQELPASFTGASVTICSTRYYPEYEAIGVLAQDEISGNVIHAVFANSYDLVSVNQPLSQIVEAECLLSNLLESSDLDVTALTSVVRGYKVTSIAAIRSAIDPLSSAFPFDTIQNGYKIKFIPRPKVSSLVIPYDDLGCVASGDSDAPRLTEAREMDTQLPRKVTIQYLDVEREYDLNEQSIERLNTDAINHLKFELPIVLVADEAAKIAESSLYRMWLERNDLQFVLPPMRNDLQPADVITLETPDADLELRLVAINNLPDGRVEVTAKHNASSVYSPNAVGADGVYFGQTGLDLPLIAPVLLTLIDGPCLTDAMNSAGYLAAMSGYVDNWSGANAWKSSDGGLSYQYFGSFSNQVTTGITTTALASGRTDIIDVTNTVNLNLLSNSLSSVTIEQLLSGKNHFAIGADQRWEVVGAKTVTVEMDGSVTLSNLLRGRVGTEWAMTTHEVGDTVVWLNDPDLAWVTTSFNDIGLVKNWKSAPSGVAIDSEFVTDVEFIYRAQNLECLAPLYVKANKAADTGTWVVEWTRQSRVGYAWRDNVDASLGEPSENYSVDFYSDQTFTTVLGTVATTTQSLSLTTAQQTPIFGSSPDSVNGEVFQLSEFAGRGRGTRFTRVMPDPYWDVTVLAMHFDGANNDTAVTDEKGHTLTLYGTSSALILSTTQKKFGTTSAKGKTSTGCWYSGNDLSEFDPGSSNFTIDCWVYIDVVQSGGIFLQKRGASLIDYKMYMDSTRTLYFDYVNTLGNTYSFYAVTKIPLQAWTHIAFVRSTTTGMLFINGVKDVTTLSMSTFTVRNTSGSYMTVCGDKGSSGVRDSYVDDLRLTKAARWTANFTPPTSEFYDG